MNEHTQYTQKHYMCYKFMDLPFMNSYHYYTLNQCPPNSYLPATAAIAPLNVTNHSLEK